MEICHVIDHWGLGGAQRAVAAFAHADHAYRHEIVVLHRGGQFSWKLPPGCEVTFLAPRRASIPQMVRGLKRYVQHRKPDAIHVHLNGARFVVHLALMGMEHPPVVIWHEHSGREIYTMYGRLLGFALLFILRRFVRRVKVVTASSNHALRFCRHALALPEERTALIHLPIHVEGILEEAEYPLQEVPEQARMDVPVLGFVGRLVEQKGVVYLMKVAQLLRELRPECQLWVVGDGPLMSELARDVERSELGDTVVLWGRRRDVFAVMKRMQVVLMPSVLEPLGLVAIEAFTLGKPVVGFEVDGLAEVLKSSPLGSAVKTGDYHRLYLKATQMLDFESGACPGFSGADCAFSDPHCLDDWQDFYDAVLGRAGQGIHGDGLGGTGEGRRSLSRAVSGSVDGL